MSRCRKRKPSSSGNVGDVERMSSLRTSVARWDSTAGRRGSGESTATEPRWKTSPSTDPRSMTTRTSPSSESIRAWRSAWIVGGTTISPSPPCSRTIASISSTYSGLPADATVIRSRRSPVSGASATSSSMSAEHSSGASGSSRRDVALSLPPAQPGRTSSSSVRAMQSRKIGASRDMSETCSTRSTNTGSAHWRSSITTTCGRSSRPRLEEPPKGELRLRRRRADDRLGLDADRDQDLDERPVRDPLAVREAPSAQDVGRRRPRARGSPQRAATSRCRLARGA